MYFPWQAKQWQQLYHSWQQDRLPHALAFTGPEGLGKAEFAQTLAHALLCEKVDSNGLACQSCRACRLVLSGAHPGLLSIKPEKAGHPIKVDQVREVGEFCQQTALIGDMQVVLIDSACSMNLSASNALLKTLEEPSDKMLLLLVIHHPERLPKTILSRCQAIHFAVPPQAESLAWLDENLSEPTDTHLLLNLAHGMPLHAKELATSSWLEMRRDLVTGFDGLRNQSASAIALASGSLKLDVLPFIDVYCSWLADVIKMALTQDGAAIVNSDRIEQIKKQAQAIMPDKASLVLSYAMQCRREVMRGANLNKQLLFESLLLRVTECFAHAR